MRRRGLHSRLIWRSIRLDGNARQLIFLSRLYDCITIMRDIINAGFPTSPASHIRSVEVPLRLISSGRMSVRFHR